MATAAMSFACGSFGEGQTGAPDAAGDGPSSDGASGVDAGVDASRQRCTGTERFTDSFDRELPAAGDLGWSLAPDASLQLLPDAGSPPPALFASAPALDQGRKVGHTMTRTFDLGVDSVVCLELDVHLEKAEGEFTNDSYAEIFDVHATGTTSVYFELAAEGVVFTQDATHAVVQEPVLGGWRHLVVRIPYGSDVPPSLEMDGEARVAGHMSAGPKPSAIEVDLGLQSDSLTGTTAAMRVHIDNFRLTTSP